MIQLVDSYKTKYSAIMWPRNFILGWLSPKMKNVSSHKNLYMKPYSSLICNSQKLKIDSLQRKNGFTNCGTVGQEILISNEKQWTSMYLTTWWVSGELCWLKKKKPIPKISHCIPFTLYLWNDKIVEVDNRPVVVRNGGVETSCGFSMAT